LAYPQCCIKGIVYGLIPQYYSQNSYRKGYIQIVSLFYHRICTKGWDPIFIRNLIVEASRRIENTTTVQQQQQKHLSPITTGLQMKSTSIASFTQTTSHAAKFKQSMTGISLTILTTHLRSKEGFLPTPSRKT